MAKEGKPTAAPRLRFPEFRANWKPMTVGDFFDLDGKAERTRNFDAERLLTVKLHGNGVVKNEKSTLIGGANYFTRTAGQFIFSKIDLVNGAFGIVPDALDGYSSSSDVPAYSFNAKHAPAFFLNWLTANYGRLPVERTGTSNTLKRVAPENFFALDILAPSLTEQKKIADCLTSLDEVIAAQGRKVEALKAHKRGLMQQLFPRAGETRPRLRFPEFRDAPEWKKATIGSLSKSFSGGTPETSDSSFYGGTIPFIRSAEIGSNTTELFLTDDGLKNSSAKLVKQGDVLVALYGANSGEVALAKIFGAINQAVLCIRPEGSKAFLYHSLTARKPWIVGTFIQGGQGNLSGKIVKSIALRFPSVKEQQRVADCLSSLDNLITAESSQLAALKTHKQGLMQQLFPAPGGN